MQKLIWQNANGDEINLTSGNYGITEWEGFSNASLNIQSQQVPFQDGGVFLDALIEQRELSVTLKMQDNGNLEERYRMRRELIHALNPKLGEGYLIYTNDFTSKRIKCVPQIPLFPTHNSNDSGTPSASLAWTACEPYWEDLEETIVVLNNGVITNIQNEGDVDIGFKAVINPSCVNPEIVNLIEEKKIKIQKSITENTEINTDFGKKSIEEIKYNYKYVQGGEIRSLLLNNSELYIGGEVLTKFDVFNKNELLTIFLDIGKEIKYIVYLNNNFYILLDGEKKLHITNDFETATETVEINYTIKKVVTINNQIIVITEGYTYRYDNNNFIIISDEVLEDICYKDGYYYGITSTELKKSLNFETWETVKSFSDILEGKVLYNISYNDGICVILSLKAAENGLGIISSNDLETWNQVVINDAFIPQDEQRLCFCNNMFFFISLFHVYTTTDGININTPYYEELGDIKTIMTDGFSVYIGTIKGQVINTVNGISFNSLFGDKLPTFNDIKYYSGKYYGVGSISTVSDRGLFESDDCRKWIFKNSDFYVNKFTIFNGIFYGIKSSNSEIQILKYIDNSCSVVFIASYSQYGRLEAITVGNNKICAITSKGCVVKSSNGVNWDIVEIDISKTFRNIAYCNNQFVIVGNNGDIYTSDDLTEWTHLIASFNEDITDIIYNNGFYLLYAGVRKIYKIYKTYNLTSFTLVATTFSKTSPFTLIFSEICFLSANKIVSTIDGNNFKEDKLGIIDNTSGILVCGHNGKFFRGNVDNYLYDSTEQKTNIIDKLTSDSDMSLKLKVGRNQYKTQSQSGNFTTVLSYRQKYLGV